LGAPKGAPISMFACEVPNGAVFCSCLGMLRYA